MSLAVIRLGRQMWDRLSFPACVYLCPTLELDCIQRHVTSTSQRWGLTLQTNVLLRKANFLNHVESLIPRVKKKLTSNTNYNNGHSNNNCRYTKCTTRTIMRKTNLRLLSVLTNLRPSCNSWSTTRHSLHQRIIHSKYASSRSLATRENSPNRKRSMPCHLVSTSVHNKLHLYTCL